jgi:hypothetical protein
MVFAVAVLGVFVATVVSVLVYADAARRDFSRTPRLAWSALVGTLSVGGFVVPHALEDSLNYAYLLGVKPRPVVSSPIELLSLHLGMGIAIAACAVLLYALGSRHNSLKRV